MNLEKTLQVIDFQHFREFLIKETSSYSSYFKEPKGFVWYQLRDKTANYLKLYHPEYEFYNDTDKFFDTLEEIGIIRKNESAAAVGYEVINI